MCMFVHVYTARIWGRGPATHPSMCRTAPPHCTAVYCPALMPLMPLASIRVHRRVSFTQDLSEPLWEDRPCFPGGWRSQGFSLEVHLVGIVSRERTLGDIPGLSAERSWRSREGGGGPGACLSLGRALAATPVRKGPLSRKRAEREMGLRSNPLTLRMWLGQWPLRLRPLLGPRTDNTHVVGSPGVRRCSEQF